LLGPPEKLSSHWRELIANRLKFDAVLGANPIHAKEQVIYMSLMDVTVLTEDWRKASRSVNNGACVEVGSASARVLVRDSVNPSGPAIAYAPAAWRMFVNSAKVGAFDSFR
jgi:hypothetical protein